MLLTENIVYRVREWLDGRDDEPDLVPRIRRLWTEAAAPRDREVASEPRPLRLIGRPTLGRAA
jgi:hypothetical protein